MEKPSTLIWGKITSFVDTLDLDDMTYFLTLRRKMSLNYQILFFVGWLSLTCVGCEYGLKHLHEEFKMVDSSWHEDPQARQNLLSNE